MNGTTLGLVAVAVLFAIDVVLLLGLLVLKEVHRRRAQRHRERRGRYVAMLSEHLATGAHIDLTADVAGDDAFLDAVIDLRDVLSGEDVETLHDLVDGLGLADRQIEALASRFPLGRRLRAAVALAEMGDDSTAPVLIAHLADREPEIRIQCARGLGRMHYTPAIDAILERLSLEDPWVRVRFADTLVRFGTKATWPLVAYIRVNLSAPEKQGVIEAIRVLGTIGDREVGPTLAGILRVSDDPEVKLATIEALGLVGGPLAIRPLNTCYRSPDWRLRAKAATALGHIGDPSCIPILAKGLRDANWWVRRNSAAALATLPGGDRQLILALKSEDQYARDAAAEALAGAGVLASARERFEAGEANELDRMLLDHVGADEAVPA